MAREVHTQAYEAPGEWGMNRQEFDHSDFKVHYIHPSIKALIAVSITSAVMPVPFTVGTAFATELQQPASQSQQQVVAEQSDATTASNDVAAAAEKPAVKAAESAAPTQATEPATASETDAQVAATAPAEQATEPAATVTASAVPAATPAAPASQDAVSAYDPVANTSTTYSAYTQIDGTTTTWDGNTYGGVYVASGETTISGQVQVIGNVTLILRDGCKLTCPQGIVVGDNGLTIKSETKDGNGELVATGNYSAGIGSKYWEGSFGGTIVIDGGIIRASAPNSGSAGIGGGGFGTCKGTITINGGDVHATGGTKAAGIGGGYYEDSPQVKITGGTVEATGTDGGAGIGAGFGEASGGTKSLTCGAITITGGKVTAKGGDNAAGIGSSKGINGPTISITGGKVDAKGGSNAAGVGGGHASMGIKVTIGGRSTEVTAFGGDNGCGIGGMSSTTEKDAPTITILDGTINATGGAGAAGIGSSKPFSWGSSIYYLGPIVISGGHVTAAAGSNSAGIGSCQETDCAGITISGKNTYVDATGGDLASGIGGGQGGHCGTLHISDATVIARGGIHGAGIGDGPYVYSGDPSSITIDSGNITAIAGKAGAGIGTGEIGDSTNPLNITINGGTINATGGDDGNLSTGGAGIGSGMNTGCGTITINGGNITATGKSGAAGIGSGCNPGSSKKSSVIISNGTIVATGGTSGPGIGRGAYGGNDGDSQHPSFKITISGGDVTAYAGPGDQGAAIGGSVSSTVSTITISGGKVRALRSTDTKADRPGGGAGIGGGAYDGGYGSRANFQKYGTGIYITGGEIEAEGGKGAAAIGGGMNGTVREINISGGTINGKGAAAAYPNSDRAQTSGGAGIGTGNDTSDMTGMPSYYDEPIISEDALVNISGGTIDVTGGPGAAGIGGGGITDGGIITITAGSVRAQGGANAAGIGGGVYRDGSNVTISGGTVIANHGENTLNPGGGDAADIGHGLYPDTTRKTSPSFSTGDNGCAVIVAKTISADASEDAWKGIFFGMFDTNNGIGAHGVVKNGTPDDPVVITTNEYIPEGCILDVRAEDSGLGMTASDKVTVANDAKLTNYGTIYVFGTYDNLDERSVTNVEKGRVLYRIDGIVVCTDPAKMAYYENETLDLAGMQMQLHFKSGQLSDAIDWPAEGYTAVPDTGTVLKLSDNGRHIDVTLTTNWLFADGTVFSAPAGASPASTDDSGENDSAASYTFKASSPGALTVTAKPVPVTPEKPDTPDQPDKPDVPDTPDTPDVPDTPDQPTNPETPSESDVPEAPKVEDAKPAAMRRPRTPQAVAVPNTGDATAHTPLAATMFAAVGSALSALALGLRRRNRHDEQ